MSTITLNLDLNEPKALAAAIRMLQAAESPGSLQEFEESITQAVATTMDVPVELLQKETAADPKPPAAVTAAAAPPVTASTPPPVTNATAPPPPAAGAATLEATPTAPAPAPPVEMTNTASTGDSPALDSAGMPWDTRINNDGKTQMANGTWKLRVKPKAYETKEAWLAFVAGVQTELKAAMGAVVPAPAAASPAPTPATPQVSAWNLGTFLVAIQAHNIPAGVVDQAIHTASAGAINDINLLGARADLIPAVVAQLNLTGG